MVETTNGNVKPPDPGRNGKLPITKRRWYQLVIIFVIQLVLTATSIIVAISVDRNSNHAWCEMVVSLDDGNKAHPPVDDQGRMFAAEISRLRRKFGCH